MISLGRSKNPAISGYENEKPQPLPLGHYFLLLVIVGAAFALRYWFNFVDQQHLNTYGACDASEYLRNAQAMLKLGSSLPESFWADSYKVLINEADPGVVQRVQTALASLKDLQIAGPTFSAFLALCYAAALTPFDITNWQVPLFAQCLISALTCLFIALTGVHAFNKPTGYIAGFLAACYPAFIVNSGRLYSETFAAFLLSIILYITARNFTTERDGSLTGVALTNVINGGTAALLQLTRSIMVVLTVALLPVVLFQQGIKKGVLALLTFVVGFALVVTPWLVFQKLAFGNYNLIVDRVGHYNFFIGNNVDTSGWLSFPYPDGRGIEEKSLYRLGTESYAKSPGKFIRLMQDKPLRLFKFPWNDFRASIGSVGFDQQVLFHQIVMLLAGIGLILSFLVKNRRVGPDTDYERGTPSTGESKSSNAAKAFILFTFMLHGAYLLFITVPRYNLTAMPEVILFAAAGITSIIALLKMRRGALAASALILASVFLFAFLHMPIISAFATLSHGQHVVIGLVIQCLLRTLALLAFVIGLWLAIGALTEREIGDERRRISHASNSRVAVVLLGLFLFPVIVLPAGADGRPFEWEASMSRTGDVISQKIAIPKDFAPATEGRQPYLLIDANGLEGLAQTQVEVNGQKLDAPLIPGIAMCDDFTRFQDVSDSGYMREGEWVFDCLTQSAGMHNPDLRQWFIVPIAASKLKPGTVLDITLRNMSVGKSATVYGAYSSSDRSVAIPSVALYSWEKAFYGVESDHNLSDTRYNSKTDSMAVQPNNTDLSPAPGFQSGRFNVHLLAGAPIPVNTTVYTVTKEPQPMPACAVEKTQSFAPELIRDKKPTLNVSASSFPRYGESTLWIVRLSGKAKRNTGTAVLNVSVKALTADKNKQAAPIAYVSPWGTNTSIGTDWRRFDVAFPLAPGALRAPLTKLSADLTIGQASGADGVAAEGVSELKDISLQIWRLPKNPLHGPYQVL